MQGGESFYTNRYICDMLKEMRDSFKTHNYAPIPGLIEEVQSAANRMEAGLANHKDLVRLDDLRSEGKKEYKKLSESLTRRKAELEDLQGKIKKQKAELGKLNLAFKKSKKI